MYPGYMPKVMITGVNGFVGKHLARELMDRGMQVVGAGREPALHPALTKYLGAYTACDLTDQAAVGKLPLGDVRAVVSLAGFAKVGDSFGQDDIYTKVNVGVLSTVGERLIELGSKARVIAVSTGAVYASDQPLPLTEESTLITNGSPYALSKLAMEEEADRMRALGLNCIVARPFNHIGPGQEEGFLVPDLYRKIVQALKTGEAVKVGNLNSLRDYTDVRDVVRAYADLIEAATLEHDTYNICSGKSVKGETILGLLMELMDAKGKVRAEEDKVLLRSSDPDDLYGSFTRLHAQSGWQPQIPLEQTLKDFVESSPSA